MMVVAQGAWRASARLQEAAGLHDGVHEEVALRRAEDERPRPQRARLAGQHALDGDEA